MERTVFQSNKMIPIGILAVLVVGELVVFSQSKSKLVIEDGMLRYQTLRGGDEVDLKNASEIVIREVETIVDKSSPHDWDAFYDWEDVKGGTLRIGGNNSRPVDQERQVQKIIYIIDHDGRTIFSMPANMVRFTERTRFAEAIHAVNPDIQVF